MARISLGFAACLIAAALSGSCATHRSPRLSDSEAAACKAKGGYESKGGFGEPFCQFRYSDGGKVCTGKADCQGSCLTDDQAPAGTPVVGHCTAEQSVFGCYGDVEAGKAVDDFGCAD
jgi:hypothetical protein